MRTTNLNLPGNARPAARAPTGRSTTMQSAKTQATKMQSAMMQSVMMRSARRKSAVDGRSMQRRRGAVIVEFAVLLPILLTVVFGIIEFGYMFFVRQTLINASREGARLAIVLVDEENREEIVVTRVGAVLEAGQLPAELCTITYETQPPPIASHQVTVSIPYSEVSLVGGWFGMDNFPLGASCMMYGRGVGE